MTSIFLPIKTIGFLAYSKPRCPSQTMGTPFWCRDFYPHVQSQHVGRSTFMSTWNVLEPDLTEIKSCQDPWDFCIFIEHSRSPIDPMGNDHFWANFPVPKPWIKGILGCNQHHLRWPSIGKCVYMVVLICPDHCPTLLMCFFLLIVIPVSDRITLSDWVVKKWPPNRGGKLRFHHSQKVIGFGGVEDHHQVDADLVATPLKPGSFDIIQRRTRRTQRNPRNLWVCPTWGHHPKNWIRGS